jgi:hypothetical protein
MLSPAPVIKKKRRAKRARARQRARYDLRDRYRERDLPVEHIGIAQIEDPYAPAAYDTEGNLDPAARLAPVQHADGTLAEGQPAWTPPRRPTMTVIRALRDDPIGRMHSRRQIDEAQYSAARAYQELVDRTTIGAVRSVDLSKTKVSGVLASDPLTPGRQRAMQALRVAEQRVANRFGLEGLSVTRAVLSDRQSVEQTARSRGASSPREMSFWTGLFRRCLDVLAAAFGFATSTYRPRPLNGHAEHDPALDRGRMASELELADPRLRGRAGEWRLTPFLR